MWCRTCQQDVPAVSSQDGGAVVCCARCGEPFEPASGTYVAAFDESVAASQAVELTTPPAEQRDVLQPPASAAAETEFETLSTPFSWDDAGLEEDLRRVERIVQRLRLASRPTRRVDSPQASHGQMAWHVGHGGARRPRQSLWMMLSWAALALGLAAFACGGVLIALAWSNDRPNLWPLGLPVMIVGQILLLLGMLGLLDSMWQTHRQAHLSMELLDRQMQELMGVHGESEAAPSWSLRGPTASPSVRTPLGADHSPGRSVM